MKVIIAGSRTVTDYAFVKAAILSFIGRHGAITEIVSGGARGADYLGELYAQEQGVEIKVFEADWNKNGKAAGPIRNSIMAQYADGLIAVWDGQSRGTKDMIDKAVKRGLKIEVHHL